MEITAIERVEEVEEVAPYMKIVVLLPPRDNFSFTNEAVLLVRPRPWKVQSERCGAHLIHKKMPLAGPLNCFASE